MKKIVLVLMMAFAVSLFATGEHGEMSKGTSERDRIMEAKETSNRFVQEHIATIKEANAAKGLAREEAIIIQQKEENPKASQEEASTIVDYIKNTLFGAVALSVWAFVFWLVVGSTNVPRVRKDA